MFLKRACRPHVRFWHRAENFGSATTSAAIWGYKRRAESVDAMPSHDPYRPEFQRAECDTKSPMQSRRWTRRRCLGSAPWPRAHR